MSTWIGAARAGSAEAFGQLMAACRQYLLLVANREVPAELRGKVGPSDLVQETFLEAQAAFVQFQGKSESELLAWLRRILINNLRDVGRRYQETGKRNLDLEVPLSLAGRRSPPGQQPLAASLPSPSGVAIQKEHRRLVAQALRSLPPQHREVIELRNFHLRSFREIGVRMNRSPDAARKLWSRAMDNLALRLNPQFPDSVE